MTIKQIIHFLFLPALMLIASVAALVSPAAPASALSQDEKKACYSQWAGRTTGTAGDGKKYNEANFKKSKCAESKGGTCKIERYEDGSAIWCKKKNGTYANGNVGWAAANPKNDTDDDSGDDSNFINPIEGDGCAGVDTAIIKCDPDASGETKTNGVWQLLLMVVNILTAGVGVIAVAGIVYGAVLYTTAEDKADQVKQATNIITNVVIGLVLFALMWAGLNFIVPGGVFS